MIIPIDYNKMQADLDRRKYMGQVYTGKTETWKPTKLGMKTYGKWCDLVGWENLNGEKWISTDDFMNLAVKRKWVEIIYSFEKKENVCMQTKYGHDLFKTFEYWIDVKAQKRAVRKKKMNGIMVGFQKALQGMPKIMQQICTMMASLAPPEQSKTKRKLKRRKKNKDINTAHTFEEWNELDKKEWWKV